LGKLDWFNQSSFTARLKLKVIQEQLPDVSCRIKSQMQSSRMLSELRRDPVCFPSVTELVPKLECLKQSSLQEAINFRFEQTDEAFALTAA
jgi:hypothetical protein